MQKFLRTLTFMALLCVPWVTSAQETVTIGEGTSTTYVTPFNSLWGYSFVEQIYLASEIGTDGNITAVRFYLSSGTQTNNITLYMKNVTRSTFSSSTDYEPVSASDIVFTGSVTFASGWVEILLEQPFEYDGSSNLLVAMHEYTSGYSTLYFNYTEATDRVITFHSDSANPDPYNLDSYSGNKYTSANRANIQLDIEPAGSGPVCYKVTNLAIDESSISSNSLTLTWTDTRNSAGATYTIYNGDVAIASGVADTSYTVENLSPNTLYAFSVSTDCGGDNVSNRTAPVSGRTACAATTSIPFNEDFGSYGTLPSNPYTGPAVLPSCWAYLSNGTNTARTTGSTYFGGIGKYTSTSSYGTPYANDPFLCMPIYLVGSAVTSSTYIGYEAARGNTKYAILPNFEEALNTLQISFDYRMSTAYSATGAATTLELGYVIGEDTSTFVSMKSYQSITTLGKVVEQNLSLLAADAPAGARLAFKFSGVHNGTTTSSYGQYYAGIDNIVVEPIPSCIRVSNLAVTGATSSSISLKWADEYNTGASYSIFVGAPGETTLWGTTEIGDTTYTLEGLNPNLAYRIGVAANCSETDMSDTSFVNGRTSCGVESIPFAEYFDASLSSDYCWRGNATMTADSVFNGATLTLTSVQWTYATSNSGLEGGHYYKNVYGTSCHSWMITPEIDLTNAETAQLSFDVALTQWNSAALPSGDVADDKFMVIISTDGGATWSEDNATVWQDEVGDFSYSDLGSLTYQNKVINLEQYIGQTIKIAFYAESTESGDDNNLHIDNILVGEVPNCDAIEGLTLGDVFGRTADLSWNESEAEGYIVEFRKNSETEWTAIQVEDTLYTLTGLEPETAYKARVSAMCGNSTSYPSSVVSFTTKAACQVPTNVNVDPLAYAANVTWHDTIASAWKVACVIAPGDTAIWDVDETAYTIEDLTPETQYKVRVLANCGEEDSLSAWTAWKTFTTTAACAAPTNIRYINTPGDGTVATIAWHDIQASQWEIVLMNVTDTLDTEGDTTFFFEDLTAEQAYTVKVRAVCGDNVSQWATLTFTPSGKTTIGTNQTTNSYLPTACYYNNSLTQQLYTTAELGEAGMISSIDFMCGSAISRTLDVYVVSTEANTLTTFLPVTEADKVFSGSVAFTANAWKEITFTTPFYYDGLSNVVIVVDDNTGSWTNGISFKTYNATSQAISVHSDGTNYDPIDPSSYSASAESSKNYIRIMKSEPPACAPITGLTASEVHAFEATVSWNPTEADVYMLEYKVATEEGWEEIETAETTHTLALEENTTYNVRVKGICGDDESDYSSVLTLTTPPACVTPTNLRVELDEEDFSIASVIWTDLVGSEWEVRYAEASDTSETSSTYVEVSDTIFTEFEEPLEPDTWYFVKVRTLCGDEGESDWSEWFAFQTNIACEEPTNVRFIGTMGDATVATIEWDDENAEAWEIRLIHYGANGVNDTSETYSVDEGEPTFFFENLVAETEYRAEVRANCGDYLSRWAGKNFTPSLKTIIGTPETTNSYIPTYSYYNNTLSQQIYTTEELGLAGMISSIDLLPAGTKTRTIDIYMVSTDKSSFSNGTDWITVTAADKVFSGEVTFTAGEWITFQFETPFMYNGQSNVALIVDDNTGSWSSGLSFYVFNATGQAIYVASDGTNYDPAAPSSYSGTVLNVKNYIRIMKSNPPACEIPGNLTASDITGHEATLEWEGGDDAEEVYIQYKKATATTWTDVLAEENPFILEGLDQNSDYNARVMIVCENDSLTSTAITFHTLMTCEDPTGTITAVPTPGNGTVMGVEWNVTNAEEAGSPLQLVLLLDDEIIETVEGIDTAGTHLFEELIPESIYTLGVRYICDAENNDYSGLLSTTCNPSNKVIVGTDESTNSYIPTYNFYKYSLSEQIYTAAELGSTAGAIMSVDFMNKEAEKTRNIAVYLVSTTQSSFSSTTDWIHPTANDLVFSGEVTFTPNEWVTLEFDEPFMIDGESNVVLIVDDNTGSYTSSPHASFSVFSTTTDQAIYKYNDGTNYNPATMAETGILLSEKNHVRFLIGEPPTCPKPRDLAVDSVGKHIAVLSWTEKGEAEQWQIRVNNDNEWLVDAYSNPFILEGLEPETDYTVEVRAVCGEEDSSDWSNSVSFTTNLACPAVTNIEVDAGPTVAIVSWQDANYEEGTLYNIYMMEDGIPTTVATGLTDLTYTIENLQAETPYVIGVQADCPVEESSADTVYFEFTTSVDCPTPYGLTVDEESLTAHEATIEWTGFSNEGYNVRYRRPSGALIETINEDFENGLSGWTIYAMSETVSGRNGWYTIDPTAGLDFEAHSGDSVISAWSWNNYEIDADNWLITPQIELGGSMSFWVRTNAGYPDSYEVLLSTTGNETTDFTVTLQEMEAAPTTGEWEEVTIDLSGYAGQQGYVAIHHVDYDMNYLLIDDISIYEPDPEAPAEPWTTVTAQTTNVTLSGLNAATTYVVQVQAACDEESWSAVKAFTTLPSCFALDSLKVVEDMTTSSSITLSWENPNEGEGNIVVTDDEGNVLDITDVNIESGCTVTGLEPNTTYHLYVRLFCSDEDSSAAVSVRATTDCAPISELPYVENFDGNGINCWNLYNFFTYNSASYALNGTTALLSAYNRGDTMFAILPVTEANISDLALSFFNATTGTTGVCYVGYVNADGDTASFVALDSLDMTALTFNYTESRTFTFEGAPEGSRMALRVANNTDANLMIDSLTVFEKPACMAPYALTYDNVENHSVELSWTNQGEATAWQIMVNGDEENLVDATTNPFVLTGLAADSTQFVQVRANCGAEDGVSEWSGAVYFTTLIACPAPTDVTTTAGPYSAIVNWTPSIYEGVAYNVYSCNEDGEIVETVASGLTEPTYTITGLEPQTTGYHYAVAVDCSGNNDGESELTHFTFNTTVACPAPTQFVTTATATSITVSWTDANSDLATYDLYRLVTVGDTQTVATGITYSQLPYTISDLTPNTSYTFIVQSICPEDLSSNKVQFTALTNEECPENMICIGAGNSTNNNLPTNCWYNYSLTEQIYTAEELGEATTILSVDLKNTSSNDRTRTVDVYMINTNKSAFAGGSDWVAVTEGDKVFSGEVTFTGGEWSTITFDTPFNYDGTSNVVLAIDDNSGEYSSSTPFSVFSATSQAIYAFNDNTNYDPVAPSSYSGTVANVKNRVRFGTGEAPVVHTVTVTAMPADGGAVYGIDGEPVVSPMTIADGEPLTLTATAAEGYEFFEWQIGNEVNTENPLNIVTVTEDMDIVAVFNEAGPVEGYTVTVNYDATMGTVTSEPETLTDIEAGTLVTLTASPATCYNFTGWVENGEIVSEDATYSFEVNEDVTLEATFEAIVNYAEPVNETACDSYTWNGEIYTTTDIYTFETTDVEGCVLIETLNLTINYSNEGVDEQIACDEFDWIDGNVYTESNNEAQYTMTNAAGCDSVVTLNLTVNYSNSEIVVETINENDLPYTFMNNEYEAPVVREAIEAGENVDGCDSTVYFTLIVNMNGQTNVFDTICDNELPYTWNNVEFTEAGMQSVTLEDIYGADSVVNMYLTVNYGTHTTETVVACNEYIWNGETYTVSDTYVYEYTNVDGCASDSTLNLTINTPVNVAYTVTACESYTWNDNEYLVSGDYEFSHADDNGCTQVDTLHLTINNPVNESVTVEECGSYTWNGTEYTESGDYQYSHLDDNGCTQVDTLHLTINNPVHESVTVEACESYTWNETEYTESGDYEFSHLDDNGCTQVDTLHLTINNPVHMAESAEECGSYTWNGTEYTVSGNYTFAHTDDNGCTQVDTLHLTINNPVNMAETVEACESYTWNETEYTVSGDYQYSHIDDNGCTQVDTLHLTINNPVNESYTETAYDTYTWNGTEYTESGDYYYSHLDEHGCTQVDTLHLTINHYDSITVVLTVNDANMGTTNPVAGTYSFYPGNTVTATATANEGYEFVGWVASMGIYSDTVSREATVTYELVPMMQGMTINVEAVFQVAQVPPTYYTVSISVNPENAGTVTGAPEFNSVVAGTELHLTAVPANNGYVFVNWTVNGVTVEGANLDTVVNADMTIVANFEAIPVINYYTVSVTSADANMGSATATALGQVAENTLDTATATALEGYHFVNWTDAAGNVLDATNPYIFTVTADVTLVANFEANIPGVTYYTVSVTSANANMGSATATALGQVAENTLDTATATPLEGYHFVNWTDAAGNVLDATNPYIFTVTSDVTLVANFEADQVTYYTVSISVNPADAGTVTGAPEFNSVVAGTELHLTAVPANNGYVFVNWTVNNTTVTGANLDTVVNADMTIVANFQAAQPTTYNVIVNYDHNMGTVEGIPATQAVAAGTQLTLVATALEGYEFVNWTVNNETVEGATYSTVVNSDLTITANFRATVVPPTKYFVTVNYDETMGTVTGIPTDSVEAGSTVTLTATAKTGYAFVGWLIGEDTVSFEATYIIRNIQSDVTISAIFRSTIGIDDVDMSNVSIYSANSTIYVKGAEGQTIHIYDLNGRTVVTKTNAAETMAIPMGETGVYLVRVGNAAAKRVMLMR